MKTVRRLYFYAVAFISLEVVLWGLIGLLRSILNAYITNNADALAQALSLILVGVPIFLFHWLWTQRVSARDEEEKTAGLRAVFFYLTLLATLIPVIQNLLALVDRGLLTALNISAYLSIVGGSQTWLDNIVGILMNTAIAAYFWNILRGEWLTLPNKENFSDTRRLYRFVWTLYGLLMAIFGAQQVLSFIFTIPTYAVGNAGRDVLVNGIALLLIGTPIWVYVWRVCQDAIVEPAEKESMLRLGLLYLLALSGVIIVLSSAGSFLFTILNRVFGENMIWGDFIGELGGPISIGIPFAATWAYYGKWLNQRIESEEDLPRRSGMRRVYYYILSAIGLTASVAGLASLLMYIIDMATQAQILQNPGQYERLSGALSAIAVGLPLWLIAWRPMQSESLEDNDMGDHARRSVIRKTYLYLALFASVIGGMIAAVALVYNLINAALGGASDSFASDVLDSLQFLFLFAVLLAYHLSALQKDNAATSDALESKQGEYPVAVIESTGGFGEAIQAALQKHAPRVPVTIHNANENVAAENVRIVVLPSSLSVKTTEALGRWLRDFGGTVLVVPDESDQTHWVNDANQAAQSIRQLAEGREIRSAKKGASAWMIVIYIFAALFALQILFLLITLAISSIINI